MPQITFSYTIDKHRKLLARPKDVDCCRRTLSLFNFMIKMKSTRCQQHPERFYTNFCCSRECMVALCPECLPTHLRSHRCNNESVQPIEKVYERATRTSEKCFQEVTTRLKLIRDRQTQLLSHSQNKNTQYLESFKKRLLDLVQRHFTKMAAQLQQAETCVLVDPTVRRTVEKYESFKDEVSKIRKNLIECVQLNEAFRVMLTIDSMNFFQSLKSETDYVSASLKAPTLQITPSALADIEQALQKAVSLKSSYEIPLEPVQFQDCVPASNFQPLQLNIDKLNLKGKGSSPSELMIDRPNYFAMGCPFKILHSFEPLTKNLYIIPLQGIAGSMQIHRSQFQSRWDVLRNSRSVMTPDGQVFVLGGQLQGRQQSDPGISRLDFGKNSLQLIGAMKHPRQNHCVCWSGGVIFIATGELEPGKLLKSCQKYDVRTNQSSEIASCNIPAARATLCSFGDRFLFKFGGVDGDSAALHSIERYDIGKNVWEIVPITFGLHLPASVISGFSFAPMCFAVQINPTDILFSCSRSNSLQNTGTAVLTQIAEGEYVIRDVSPAKLPATGHFQSQPIIHSQILHVIQHCPGQKKYNVLVSDAKSWQILS